MLRKKSITQEQLMKLARSKGKSQAKNSLRSIINSKNVKLRNDQSLKDILNFSQLSNRKTKQFSNEQNYPKMNIQNSSKKSNIESNISIGRNSKSQSKNRATRLNTDSSKKSERLRQQSKKKLQNSKSLNRQSRNSDKENISQDNSNFIKIAQFDQNQENLSQKSILFELRQQKNQKTSDLIQTKQQIWTEQIAMMKKYICFLENRNKYLEIELQTVKLENITLQDKINAKNLQKEQIHQCVTKQRQCIKSLKNMTQMNSQNLEESNIVRQGQKFQHLNKKSKYDIQLILSQFSQTSKQNTSHAKEKFNQAITQFLEKQVRTMIEPLQKQNFLLKEIISVDKQQFQVKYDQLKEVLQNTQKTLKQLMNQFKRQQDDKKNIFSHRLKEERKLHGIMKHFS